MVFGGGGVLKEVEARGYACSFAGDIETAEDKVRSREERAVGRRLHHRGGIAAAGTRAEMDRAFWLQAPPVERLSAVRELALQWYETHDDERFSPDLTVLLAAFEEHNVEYLLVGGQAIALHGHPRFTKDSDIWLRNNYENEQRAQQALADLAHRKMWWRALHKQRAWT